MSKLRSAPLKIQFKKATKRLGVDSQRTHTNARMIFRVGNGNVDLTPHTLKH
jgi:hypothetical protein